MAYFNYHAKAQNQIKGGHCVKAEVVQKYNNISPALILYFDNNMPMPIRLHRFNEYFELLKQYDIEITL
ncbi:MAG: thermostable hemolysin delta-VPH [Clostridia bacterium]|nr:thermostable hemolysin delta-VPH [Clostridia bacterium]